MPHTAHEGFDQRLHVRVRGVVQGVGFRPFVYRLANTLGLSGWVRNDSEGVEIEVQGPHDALADFRTRIRSEAPPLARVDAVDEHPTAIATPVVGFEIRESRPAQGRLATSIGHDTALCAECLEELFDPGNRRYRHPFITCTQCGPRYTLAASLPYDRARTSMARFPFCADCAAEYQSPGHRRFHAEPIACPACGPQLVLRSGDGLSDTSTDPIMESLARLRRGEIIAIKGLGGFHLACDAGHPEAVARLRQRKHREEKPFAIMVANTASALRLGCAGASETALLEAPERPIVLLRKRADFDSWHPGVAPGLAWVGVMLPYTPIHHLLFHEAAARPVGTDWLQTSQPMALVMTSANPGGEPLVIDNDEAIERLAGIADAWLLHDRDILVRCDDSVLRGNDNDGGHGRFIRRARGHVPRAIKLSRSGPEVLALGAHLKNTACLTRGDEAFVSQHIGDLDNAATCRSLVESIGHLQCLLDVRPRLIAHDLQPDSFSTRHALALAAQLDVPTLAVQHHHAHIAAVLAERRVEEPVLGLALDGFGLGSDGGLWGGELLQVDGAAFSRIGHLRELALPGGDRAAREPWRMAAAALHALGRGEEIATRFAAHAAAPTVATMLARGVNSPATSSMGRCFDAAAGLLGVKEITRFEGQAAMLLEGLAEAHGPAPALQDSWRLDAEGRLDLLPLLAAISVETCPARGAACFHASLVAALEAWVLDAAQRTGLGVVALGGGCFLNAILHHGLRRRLLQEGLRVLVPERLPPSDGGIALGQAWVALQHHDNR